MTRNGWDFVGLSDCHGYHPNHTFPGFCNATWDGFLCWPLTPAGATPRQPCPANVKGILRDNFATRRCSGNGLWLDDVGKEGPDPSWTNFSACFTPELTKVIEGFYANISETEADAKASILYQTRLFEMVGYSISFASILASLCILSAFRALRTKEKRIHRHLYLAMLIQVVIRLILYVDQLVSRKGNGAIGDIKVRRDTEAVAATVAVAAAGDSALVRGIDNTPYLCESFYVLLEYCRTAMFHWFLIEGLHLHNVLTINVFQGSYRLYYAIGWGLPALQTAVWAVVTGMNMNTACWYGYNHTDYYYIVEGPRLAVIAINFLFLLNILRVLLTKLKNVNSSETVKVRKAVKAAIVLQPLLGITNSLQMMAAPYDKNLAYFAAWSFVTTFLVSFQGFFASLFYCFLNGEVRTVVKKWLDVKRLQRQINRASDRRISVAVTGAKSKTILAAGATAKETTREQPIGSEDVCRAGGVTGAPPVRPVVANHCSSSSSAKGMRMSTVPPSSHRAAPPAFDDIGDEEARLLKKVSTTSETEAKPPVDTHF